MDRQYLIIPEYHSLEKSYRLAEKYQAGFEYNDFYNPAVYENDQEVVARCKEYRSLNRNRSKDILHGVFIDTTVTSKDTVIRERSRYLVEKCLEIAGDIGVQGVVFHTGLIGGLEISSYINPWLEEAAEFWGNIAQENPLLEIYMENTFERTPDTLLTLADYLAEYSNFKFCLDYGHAMLTSTPIEKWIEQMQTKIGHIHLNDNDLKNDLHQVPGEGKIDFVKCKQLLEKYVPDVSVLLELVGIENQERALVFAKNL